MFHSTGQGGQQPQLYMRTPPGLEEQLVGKHPSPSLLYKENVSGDFALLPFMHS